MNGATSTKLSLKQKILIVCVGIVGVGIAASRFSYDSSVRSKRLESKLNFDFELNGQPGEVKCKNVGVAHDICYAEINGTRIEKGYILTDDNKVIRLSGYGYSVEDYEIEK